MSMKSLPADLLTAPERFVGNTIPTCVSDDLKTAAEVNRRNRAGYVLLSNHRGY